MLFTPAALVVLYAHDEPKFDKLVPDHESLVNRIRVRVLKILLRSDQVRIRESENQPGGFNKVAPTALRRTCIANPTHLGCPTSKFL
jgi:hypothetical protein